MNKVDAPRSYDVQLSLRNEAFAQMILCLLRCELIMQNRQMRSEDPLVGYMRSKAEIRSYENEIRRIVLGASSASSNMWLDSSLGLIKSYMNQSEFTSVDLCFALIATQYEELLNHDSVQAELFFKCFVKLVDDHGSPELAECLHRYTIQREIFDQDFEQIQTKFNQEIRKSQPNWIKIETYFEQAPSLDVNINVHNKPVFEQLVYKYVENGNRADLKIILALMRASSLQIDKSKISTLLQKKLGVISIQQKLTLSCFFRDQCVLKNRRIHLILHSIKDPARFNQGSLLSSECDTKSILKQFLIERSCLNNFQQAL